MHPPLSESDLSEDMVDPWLLFLILSVPLWSCSSRTRSSLCSQRRRSFSCLARSSCFCSFWNVADEGERDIWAKLQIQREKKGMLLERSAWGFLQYLYVKLSLSQQVQGGVPHGVGRVRNLLLQLLQALPQLSSSADYNNQQCYFFISRHITTTTFKGTSTELCYIPTQCNCEVDKDSCGFQFHVANNVKSVMHLYTVHFTMTTLRSQLRKICLYVICFAKASEVFRHCTDKLHGYNVTKCRKVRIINEGNVLLYLSRQKSPSFDSSDVI